MASIGALIVDLVAKTGGFETDLGRAARTAEKRSKEIDRSISRMGSRIVGSLAAIGAGFSFAKIIEATSQAEKALAALDNAVRNNAGAAGATTAGLADLSGELQKLTTFSDDSIQGMQALLLTFQQIGGGEFKRAQIAVLDLATALGKDLNSSALLVGRALADPIKGMTALGRAGVVLSKEQQGVIKSLVDSGRAAEAQGVILKALESRFGGAAEAARNTFGGALAGLKNAFDDLLEVKGGLPGSIDAINQFSDILQDPATKSAVDTLTSGIISGFAAAAVSIAKFAGGIKLLAEDLAAVRFGAAADDLVRLNEQLAKAQELRAAGPSSLLKSGTFFDRLRFFGKDGIVKWYDDADLDKEMKRLQGLIDQQMVGTRSPLTGATGTSATGPTAPPPPSEEFTKLAAKLNEQIALHGKVGEAAKLAYAIQSGALEELSDAEEKQLMVLARRADAVAANTEAEKAAADAQKKVLADQKQAQDSIESMIVSLRQQVETYGQGEEAVLRYRIEHGDLAETFAKAGAGADQYRQDLIALTSQMELMKDVQDGVDKSLADFAAANEDSLEQFSTTIGKTFKEATDEWTVFKDQAARNTQDIIADTLTNGFKDGTDGILKSFADMIVKLTAQAVAADIAGRLFGESAGGASGSGGGWISALAGLFGGGKATGGPVTAGTMYRVNEREPEYFKPNVGGKVVPLSKMSGGGAPITNHFTIQAPQGTVSRQTEMQIAAAASRSLASANRRNN